MFTEFFYLKDKILDSNFFEYPFKYIYIENFLSKEHFDIITNDKQIKFEQQKTTENTIKILTDNHYNPVSFPGCTTDIQKYLKYFYSDKKEKYNNDLLEGFGISFRLQKYNNPFIKNLVNFFNSDIFHQTLKNKFEKTKKTYIETAIQKYLSGYEISPHPDIRKKCLTYMLNINTDSESEQLHLHTYFMKFKKEYEHIYNFWENNQNVDRCWVPWNWCEREFVQTKNNSITVFAPSNRSLHAVKLDYDHTKLQRTQVYGNLWYIESNIKDKPNWKELPKQ